MSSSASALSDPTSTSEDVMTNAFLPGQWFQIQRYQTYVGENLKEPNDRHFIMQLCEVAWAERRGATGTWVKSLMHRGSLTIVPAGPVPEARLLTSPNIIICALEKNFIGEIALEINHILEKSDSFWFREQPRPSLV
jgi:hypothetical protein